MMKSASSTRMPRVVHPGPSGQATNRTIETLLARGSAWAIGKRFILHDPERGYVYAKSGRLPFSPVK
jgi:hypothetical protein